MPTDEAKKIMQQLKQTAAKKNKIHPEEYSHKAIGKKIGVSPNRVTDALNYKTRSTLPLFLLLCEAIDPKKKSAILKLF